MRNGFLDGHFCLISSVRLVESKKGRRFRRRYVCQRLRIVPQLDGIPYHRYEFGLGSVAVGGEWSRPPNIVPGDTERADTIGRPAGWPCLPGADADLRRPVDPHCRSLRTLVSSGDVAAALQNIRTADR